MSVVVAKNVGLFWGRARMSRTEFGNFCNSSFEWRRKYEAILIYFCQQSSEIPRMVA